MLSKEVKSQTTVIAMGHYSAFSMSQVVRHLKVEHSINKQCDQWMQSLVKVQLIVSMRRRVEDGEEYYVAVFG